MAENRQQDRNNDPVSYFSVMSSVQNDPRPNIKRFGKMLLKYCPKEILEDT